MDSCPESLNTLLAAKLIDISALHRNYEGLESEVICLYGSPQAYLTVNDGRQAIDLLVDVFGATLVFLPECMVHLQQELNSLSRRF